MKKIQAVFLDFDGVILESVDIKGWAFGKLFENQHPEHVAEIVAFHHANNGMSRFEKFRYFYKNIFKQPLTEKQFDKLCDDFSSLVFQRVLECDYVPGALEFLRRFYEAVPLFIISGTPHEEIIKIVQAKGLSSYFKGVFGSPTLKGQWLNKIIHEQNFDPEKTFFVGDGMSDYKAATENGIPFVARIKDSENNIFKDIDIFYKVTDLFELADFMLKNNA